MLDCSSNDLSGALTQNLGNLAMLEVLNISHNQFSGGIPSSFESMLSLTTLDVSYNNLKGQTQCRRLPHEWGLGKEKTEASLPPQNLRRGCFEPVIW